MGTCNYFKYFSPPVLAIMMLAMMAGCTSRTVTLLDFDLKRMSPGFIARGYLDTSSSESQWLSEIDNQLKFMNNQLRRHGVIVDQAEITVWAGEVSADSKEFRVPYRVDLHVHGQDQGEDMAYEVILPRRVDEQSLLEIVDGYYGNCSRHDFYLGGGTRVLSQFFDPLSVDCPIRKDLDRNLFVTAEVFVSRDHLSN